MGRSKSKSTLPGVVMKFEKGDVVYYNDDGVWYKAIVEGKSILYKGCWWVSSSQFSGNVAAKEDKLVHAAIYESPLGKALR